MNRTPLMALVLGVVLGVALVSAGCLSDTRLLPADTARSEPVEVTKVDARLAEKNDEPATKASNSRPVWPQLAPVHLNEGEAWSLALHPTDRDGDPLRLFAEDLPPGARLAQDSLIFRPDSIQGGQSWTVRLTATDGTDAADTTLTITVADTITPPTPLVASKELEDGWTRLVVHQVTDTWLDSPGRAGRIIGNQVLIPREGRGPFPVRVVLHGYGGSGSGGGSPNEIIVRPSDPDKSYWWGYASGIPEQVSGVVPDYTLRRVLHLMDWATRTFGGDRDRTYVTGGSMGGAGATTLGLLYARHFCYVQALIGQTVPRNHRPSRLAQLTGLWGSPEQNLKGPNGMSVWDRQDITRVLTDLPEARDQFVFTRHGKDDPLIHFGAVVTPSPLTKRSFYDAVQQERIGHYLVWDEGGHGSADPVMGSLWSDWNWPRVTHPQTFLRRDLPFPAFTESSANQQPGHGKGNGNVPWSDESGYSARVATAGDTGWDGDPVGAFNRFLRWDASLIVDSRDQLQMPLRVTDGDGLVAPARGYPTIGNKYDGPLPLVVNTTIRRTQRFHTVVGDEVRWSFGALEGTAEANPDGSVTIVGLPLTTEWATLVLDRL